MPDGGAGGDARFAGAFSEEERRELLLRCLRVFVAGGALSQPEERWTAYLEAARALYRDLAAATRGADGAVTVVSHAFALRGAGLFPDDCPHSVCLVSVDPLRRTAAVFAHTFIAGAW